MEKKERVCPASSWREKKENGPDLGKGTQNWLNMQERDSSKQARYSMQC